MTFEEQFPSFDITKHPEAFVIFSCKYLKPYVQKYCLDKGEVEKLLNDRINNIKQATDKVYFTSGCYDNDKLEVLKALEELKKRLKL